MKFKIHIFIIIFVILFSSALRAEENILGNWFRIFSVLEWKKSAEQTILAIQQQDYDQALKWGKKTYNYARQHFADDYEDILSISIKIRASTLNLKLGESYQKGDYQKALEFAKQFHQFTTQHLGNEPEFTLVSLTLLATMYGAQGEFKKAEHWLIQAQSLSQKIGTENHLSRVYIPNNLGSLYEHMGDYGNAEYYYNQALQMGKKIQIESFYICLILNRLGSLYLFQNRYQEAEVAYEEAYSLRDKISQDAYRLSPQSTSIFDSTIKTLVDINQYRNTIETLLGLASIAEHKQDYDKAKPWLEQALLISKQHLGGKNIYTIIALASLASHYASQDHYQQAEKLLKEVNLLATEVLGAEHPHTLAPQLKLAKWYYYQGRYQAAAALYKKTLPQQERLLGSEHPDIWLAYINYAACLVNLNRYKESVDLLKMMEPIQLFYAKGQFYTTGKERVRRALFTNLAGTFQSMVLTLANRYPSDPEITRLAANMLLRWKQLQAEEEAILAKLATNNQPLANLTQKIQALRAQLSHQTHQKNESQSTQLGKELEIAELEWLKSSPNYKAHLAIIKKTQAMIKQAESQLAHHPHYKSHLKVMQAEIEAVRVKLPPKSALIEFKIYFKVDFSTGFMSAEPHWAAMLISKKKTIIKDLGTISKTQAIWEQLNQSEQEQANKYAKQLYQNLFGQFEEQLKYFDTLYIAPDHFLNLIPFSRLVLPDDRYWVERQMLRLVQTGRELLRDKPKTQSNSLLAIGYINFDEYPKQPMVVANSANNLRTASELDNFYTLGASEDEVQDINALYQDILEAPSEIWLENEATEGRLKNLSHPPRILHLATHGFYLKKPAKQNYRPLVLSGLALAGANLGLQNKIGPDKEDGILYSLEILGLNLTGTELVVLSACETGQGVVDYSEGVYGLVRAFRIAGAHRVLMTLWEVDDEYTNDFMVKFYENWLTQDQHDIAEALRQTQLDYIDNEDLELRDPAVWSAYVLVGF